MNIKTWTLSWVFVKVKTFGVKIKKQQYFKIFFYKIQDLNNVVAKRWELEVYVDE